MIIWCCRKWKSMVNLHLTSPTRSWMVLILPLCTYQLFIFFLQNWNFNLKPPQSLIPIKFLGVTVVDFLIWDHLGSNGWVFRLQTPAGTSETWFQNMFWCKEPFCARWGLAYVSRYMDLQYLPFYASCVLCVGRWLVAVDWDCELHGCTGSWFTIPSLPVGCSVGWLTGR